MRFEALDLWKKDGIDLKNHTTSRWYRWLMCKNSGDAFSTSLEVVVTIPQFLNGYSNMDNQGI